MKRAKYYTDEWCPECEREVRIPARVHPHPKCPKCGKPLLPCSACDDETRRKCATCTDDGCNFKLHKRFVEARRMPHFRLRTIVNVADKAYDPLENAVAMSHRGEDAGDTLALFVARELKDVYDPDAPKDLQLTAAFLAMGRARAQLENVETALKEKWRKLCEKKSRSRKRSR